jgi:hypothetical protein
MSKTTAISILMSLIVVLCMCLVLAQTIPNLSGTWKVNPAKSKTEKTLPDGMKIRFEQKDSSIKETIYLTFGAKEQSATYEYAVDGNEVEIKDPKVPYTVSAKWEGKMLIQTWKKRDKSERFTRRYTLSDDGQSLVMVKESPESDGSVIVDTLFLEKQQ